MSHRTALAVIVLLLLGACGRSVKGEERDPKPRSIVRLDVMPSPAFGEGCFGEDGTTPQPCSTILPYPYPSDQAALYVCVKPPDGSECEERLVVNERKGLVEVEPDYWEWAVVGSNDRKVLLALQTQPYCSNFARAKVAQERGSFVITVFTGKDPEKAPIAKAEDGTRARVCTTVGSTPSAIYITLPSPLGNRKILDGSGRTPPKSSE